MPSAESCRAGVGCPLEVIVHQALLQVEALQRIQAEHLVILTRRFLPQVDLQARIDEKPHRMAHEAQQLHEADAAQGVRRGGQAGAVPVHARRLGPRRLPQRLRHRAPVAIVTARLAAVIARTEGLQADARASAAR